MQQKKDTNNYSMLRLIILIQPVLAIRVHVAQHGIEQHGLVRLLVVQGAFGEQSGMIY